MEREKTQRNKWVHAIHSRNLAEKKTGHSEITGLKLSENTR